MSAFFDLIYVSGPDGRTVTCGIMENGKDTMVGPFPAKEAGPKIVDALLEHPALGFNGDRKAAELAYAMQHFKNMSRGENEAGQAYPFEV